MRKNDVQDPWGQLIRGGQALTFRKGQVLFYEGHIPYGVFVIESGKVRFQTGNKTCSDDHLKESRQGKVLGLKHFRTEAPFCCTCVCETDCQLIFISKTQLMETLSAAGSSALTTHLK